MVIVFTMEVKVPKDIRSYKETIFFGLSLRQFLFSLVAVGVSVGVYFLLKEPLGTETVSWVCILCAAPFAAAGFFKRNGLNFEQYIWAWFKSEFLLPKKLPYRSENYYYKALKQYLIDTNKKYKTMEGGNDRVKNTKEHETFGKRTS